MRIILGGEWNENGRRCERWTKIPVNTFPRINTELFIDGKEGFIYKSKGGIGSRKYLLEEGKILAENEKKREWKQQQSV